MTSGLPYRAAPPSRPPAACPHCHASAPPTPHERLRWVCSACGGPVLRGLERTKIDPETARLLREAALVLDARTMAIRTMVRGAMAVLVGAAVLLRVGGQAIVTYLVSGLLLTFLVGVARAIEDDKRAVRARQLVDAAWTRAEAVAARERRGPILAPELAKAATDHVSAGATDEGRLSSPPPSSPSASASTKHGPHE